MASIGTPSVATREDAAAIATLFAQSWTSPFTQLQLGYVDTSPLIAGLEPRIARQIDRPGAMFLVIRDLYTREVVSVAQWTLPATENDVVTNETREEMEERQRFDDEAYRARLPDSSNKDLILEFTVGLREMKLRLLRGRKHYYLDNLATHPDYRGKGLASRLIEWVTMRADQEGMLVYLDTADDNPAIRLYKRLGFEMKDQSTIESFRPLVRERDLEMYGGDGTHVHVAFVRQPAQV